MQKRWKLGESASCVSLRGIASIFVFATAVDKQVHGGNEEDGDSNRDAEAANDRASKWSVLLTACFKSERHRNHAEQRGERGHENGTQTDFAGVDHSVEQRLSLAVQDAGELD